MDALTPSFGHPSPRGEGQGGEGNVCVRDGSGKPAFAKASADKPEE